MRITNMIYVFDIDGTICEKDEFSDANYENSKPIKNRVEIVNKLYDEGNTIIFQTARGMGRFENDAEKAIEMFYEFTAKQLSDWGVKYHQLFLGKPAGSLYIDDKGMRDIHFFEQMRKNT
jgi:histidinol phosphatase-like enzyme